MSDCGRCAGHGTIQGIRFDMESGPIEKYKEPCPQCSDQMHAFELRGEFARLIAVLADVERLEDDRNDDVSPYDYVPWPQDPELRGRVVDQLRRCLSALESTEGDS